MKPDCCKGKFGGSVDELLGFLYVVADANRLRIICLLGKGERCVCDIWKLLGIPQNLASYHLKALKDFNLIVSRKSGLKVIYSLNVKRLVRFKSLLDAFISFNNVSI